MKPPSRRVVASTAASLLIAAAVISVIAGRNNSPTSSSAKAPTANTTPATSTASTVASTTSAPASSEPAQTNSTSTVSGTIPQAIVATIDLSTAVTRLVPAPFATFPISPPGDLFPTAYAVPAGGDRIAVLDDVTGVVLFLDEQTRMEITQYPTQVPTIGSTTFIAGYFFVGPDDVLYVNEATANSGTPAIVAYGRKGDSYVDIAEVKQAVGDGKLAMGRTGIGVVGDPDPIMRYVGIDGQPSGATVDIDALGVTSSEVNTYTLQRGSHAWTVTYNFPPDTGLPPSDACVLCPNAYLGPGDTVVLSVKSPTPDGDLQTKITVLGDAVTTYDTDWNYIGTFGNKLLFDRLDQDSLDIGTVEI